jgi:hypothetical protein
MAPFKKVLTKACKRSNTPWHEASRMTRKKKYWQIFQFGLSMRSVSSVTNLDHNQPHVPSMYGIYHSTQPHSWRNFLTPNILYSTLFYHLTGILTKTVHFFEGSHPVVRLQIFIGLVPSIHNFYICFYIRNFKSYHAAKYFKHN